MNLAPAVLSALLLLAGCEASTRASVSATPASATTTPSASAPAATATQRPEGSSPPAPSAPAPLTSDPLHAVTVVDVRTGASLTIGALAAERPLLVETMAIWCTNCRSQMHEVVAAHELADFASLSIDVEPYEEPADLTAYADAEGFDWPFAKADAQLATALRERFGTAVLNPPGMPKILFRPDGSVELLPLNDELSAEELAALLG